MGLFDKLTGSTARGDEPVASPAERPTESPDGAAEQTAG